MVDDSRVLRKGLIGAIASAALCLCLCPLAFANDLETNISADTSVIADAVIVESESLPGWHESPDLIKDATSKSNGTDVSGSKVTTADTNVAIDASPSASGDSALPPSAGSSIPDASGEGSDTEIDSPSSAVADGWSITDDGSMFYENGQAIKGEKCINER